MKDSQVHLGVQKVQVLMISIVKNFQDIIKILQIFESQKRSKVYMDFINIFIDLFLN